MPQHIRYPVPEPELTPEQMIARAAAMRARVIADAEAAAARGACSVETHAAFTDAGFYRVLQPRRFGGYEFGLETFVRLVIEIGRADAGTAWAMSLGAGHAMHLASYFSEQAQAEAFGPDGHFVCPQRALPVGKAVPVEGGYRVSGSWGYASGVVHANWFMGAAAVPPDANGAARMPIAFIVPITQVKVLDDWRAEAFALQATGSNTVVIDDVFVPAHMTDRFDWPTRTLGEEGTPGFRLHGNPLYLGRPLTYFICELASPIVGAAWGALDEYEALMRGKQTSFPPLMQRAQSPFYQQWFGEAMGRVEAAQALLVAAAQQYTACGRAWAEKHAPFGVAEDTRTRQIGLQAARLACSAVDLMFTTAGTSAVKANSRLARIFRDVSMYRTHVSTQWDVLSQSAALVALGEPITI